MKRALKKLTAFTLPFLFAFGVWCSSLANPGLSLASGMPGCSQNNSPLEKPACPYPTFSCAAGSSFSLLSQGVFASVRIHDFAKNSQSQIVGTVVPIGSSNEHSLAASRPKAALGSNTEHKVSVHLLNSVLTL